MKKKFSGYSCICGIDKKIFRDYKNNKKNKYHYILLSLKFDNDGYSYS